MPSKSGFTGLDQVEGWYKARKGCMSNSTFNAGADGTAPTIILHVQDAQVISPQVLGELIYIIWYVSILDFAWPRQTRPG